MKLLTQTKITVAVGLAVLLFIEVGLSKALGLLPNFDARMSFLLSMLGLLEFRILEPSLEKNPGIARGKFTTAEKVKIGLAILIVSLFIIGVLVVSEALA